jgi:diguanylate cyclase (GGDEF)-like protein
MRISSQIVLALFLGLAAWPSGAQQPATRPLTSLAAIHALSNAEAANSIPVAFEAIVTYYKKGDGNLFVQDGDTAIYVEAKDDLNLAVGDRVLVRGITHASFRPEITNGLVTVLGHGQPPAPVRADFRHMIHADLDCRRVKLRAIVRAANNQIAGSFHFVTLQLSVDGGTLDAEVFNENGGDLTPLLDAEVEATGVVAGKFDDKDQMVGVLLQMQSMADLKLIQPPKIAPATIPVTPMDEILQGINVHDLTRRVRIQGSITYYQPGQALVLQDGNRSLWIGTHMETPLDIGRVASASGFPEVRDSSLILTDAAIETTNEIRPVKSFFSTASELSIGRHAFDLVSVEGRLLMAAREESQDEYVLVSKGHLFSAIYRHPDRVLNLPMLPMKQVPIGAMVRVTGICIPDKRQSTGTQTSFSIQLRTFGDVDVTAPPSPLSIHNLTRVVGVLLLVILAISFRAWLVERRMRRHNAGLARFEHSRSRVLAQINGSASLEEILAGVGDLMISQINCVHCWCTTADGETYGCPPQDLSDLRIVETTVPAHSGPPLATIHTAFALKQKTNPHEVEAHRLATEVVRLAIETRRLYSDLIHRSEYDPLTDVHNRFSLEKRLDSLLDSAHPRKEFFGLIYVDLDDFKSINDQYGHSVGDLYLQKVALRMLRQIRPDDMLARLGGDEFAVLVSTAHTENEVREIAQRLARCFDAPFGIDGLTLSGGASFGVAFYPANGTTSDSLLTAADTEMYRSKRAKGFDKRTS